MNNYKNFVLTLALLLLPSTLLPLELEATLLQQGQTAQLATRTNRCTLASALVAGCLLVVGGTELALSVLAPAPQPALAPYTHDYFRIDVQSPCSPMCPTYIGREALCVPLKAERLGILKRVGEICPNSTLIQTNIYSVPSPNPTPAPCTAVNTTLHQLATTCHPSTDLRAKLRARIRPLSDMRRKESLRHY